MSLPALQAIRAAYPQAQITVLARPWVADLYAREPFADDVMLYKAPKGTKGIGEKWALAKELRSKQFDAAILLQNAFEAAALVWAARIPIRIGYNRDGRGWLLTHAIDVPTKGSIPEHERFYYLELLRRAGVIPDLPASPAIRLSGAPAAREQGRLRFAELGWSMVIGMSPGAAFGTAKRWIPERFAEAALFLDGAVALFGSADERALCDDIASIIRGAGRAVHNFAGETTLREYIDLAAACTIYLTNDSGGMHIASALGVPTVAIFGATNPRTTGPTGDRAAIVQKPVPCSPCLLRECPIDHRCMTGVSAQDVAVAAKELLK